MKGALIIVALVAVANSLPVKVPLKQIAVSRAIRTTITEALAINVFDTTSIIHDISCDCEQHPYLPVYVTGFVVFGYMYYTNNNAGDKLKKNAFYSDTKQTLRFSLLVTFLILGKSVESAI